MKKKWPIDCIRDEALPRLVPRSPSGTYSAFVMLVSLRDCAPYLGTWPPDLDELVAVATRLLLVPGGPLVLEGGALTRLSPPRPGDAAFGQNRLWVSTTLRGLICYLSNLALLPDLPHQTLSRYQRAGLVRLVRRELGKFYWWRTASTFEMLDKYRMELALPRADAMLAGVPAKEGDHGEA